MPAATARASEDPVFFGSRVMMLPVRSLRGTFNRTGKSIRRGIAAAEMAMVAPLLATIIVGMIECSRGVMVKETLSNSARKGCRTGIQRTTASVDIYNDCLNIMRDNGFDSTLFDPAPPSGSVHGQSYVGSVTITVTDPSGTTLTDVLGAPSGSQVSVQVSIPVSSVMWVTSYFLQASQLESETVVMMKQ
jgi:Flp pilus assembly protein TadG